MGTPLRSLNKILSPRIISPYFDSSSKRLCKTQIIRNKNIARRLDFSEKNEYTSPINKSNISVTISDYSNSGFIKKNTNYLMLNTPNRLQIQEFGLESYKELFILGKGTYGTVVEAIFKGETVAVKIIKNKIPIREENALHLEHKNIVQILEIIHHDQQKFFIIVMENEKNSSHLQKVLDNTDIELNFCTKLNIVIDISKGVEFCHNNNILHLDLKPSNILINKYGKAKLCDFGNSHKIGEGAFHNYGTVVYSAPEILMGQQPSIQCDIYSLGIIFWQVETQKYPYENLDNKEVVIYKVVKFGLRPELPTNVLHQKFCELYQNCWQRETEKRPPMIFILQTLKDIVKNI